MALHVCRDVFAEVAFSAAGTSRFRFRSAMLPALSELTPASVDMQRAAVLDSPLALEETVFSLMEAVLAQVSGSARVPSRGLAISRRSTDCSVDAWAVPRRNSALPLKCAAECLSIPDDALAAAYPRPAFAAAHHLALVLPARRQTAPATWFATARASFTIMPRCVEYRGRW
jgi:hypothetical protein